MFQDLLLESPPTKGRCGTKKLLEVLQVEPEINKKLTQKFSTKLIFLKNRK